VVAGCLAVLGAILLTWGLQTSATVAQLISVVLAIPTLAAALLLRRDAGPAVLTPDAVAAAKDVLAGLVEQQWRTEAVLRSLGNPDPIPVRWRATVDDGLVDHPANLSPATLRLTASSDDIAALAAEFRAMRRRRLVILGGPGAGKTTLAVQLLCELVATRHGQEDEPVPVLLSVADWNPRNVPRLQDWLALRLAQDYPALHATALGGEASGALARSGQILPVLDGLDELPTPAQAAVITAVNRSLGGTDQIVLTSRTADYRRAVDAAGNVLASAVVIEPDPLDPYAAAGYLRRCLPARAGPGWGQILTQLRTTPAPSNAPIAAIADVAATPLGLWLLRTVYIRPDAEPAVLLDPDRFPDAATLRAHLFDGLIESVIATREPSADAADMFRPRRRHDPTQVRDRLGYLANILTYPRNEDGSARTHDLAWWQIARATRALSRATRLSIGLTIGLTIALTSTLSTSVAAGLSDGLTHGLGYGLALGLAAGAAVTFTTRNWSLQAPGFANLHRHGAQPRPSFRPSVNLTRSLALGLAAGLGLGLAVGLQDGLAAGLMAGLAIGSAIGAALVLGAGFTTWAEAPTPAGRADTPLANWRADRTLNLLRAITIGVTAGLIGGLAGGIAAGHSEAHPPALAIGLTVAVALGLPTGLATGHHHAWMAYVIATNRAALAGRLPRGLMSFLDDAHRLGLLRAVGPIYQFRHAELQEHLAGAYRRSQR